MKQGSEPGGETASVAAQRPLRRLRLVFGALVAFTLAALTVAEAVDIAAERERTRLAAEQRAKDLATALAEHAGGVIREIDARLAAVAAVAAATHDGAAIHEAAKRHAAALPHVGSIIVVDARNKSIGDSGAFPPRPFAVTDASFSGRRDDDPAAGVAIGKPLRSRFDGEWVIGLTRRVSAIDGGFAGVVAASLVTQRFRDVYGRLDVGALGAITLIHDDGTLLMRQPHDERLMGADVAGTPQFRKYLAVGQAGVYREPSLADDELRTTAFTRVPGLPLVVTVGLADADVYAGWRQESARRAALMILVGAIVCALAWFAIRQISAADRSAAALRANEERSRDFADATSDWYWETDEKHKLTYLSEAIVRFSGISADLRFGRSRFDFQRPDDDPEAWLRHRRDLDSNRPFRDFRYRRTDSEGRLRTISVSGKPVFDEEGRFRGYRGAATDITERVEAQQRLRDAEARLAKALDLAGDGYALLDADQRYVYFNREYLRLHADMGDLVRLGAPFGDAFREAVRRGYFPEAAGREEAFVAERLAALRSGHGPRQVYRHGRWLEVQNEPLPDGGAFSVVRDVTAERDAGQRLREAERLEAVRHLTGGVAHDFNNLLAVVLGNAALIREWVEGQPLSVRATDAILGAARRGRDLTLQLLAYARRQALEPTPVDIDALLREECAVLEKGLPKSLRIETSLEAGGWLVSVDRQQFRAALASLALNAADATSGAGRLSISTSALRLQESEAPEGCHAGEYARLRVSDDGPGMPPEVAAKAFEPFFTTKEVGAGSGLGLSMVEGFVRQSGGAVALRTAPGEGATFDLYFPRAAPGEAEKQGGEAAGRAA